MSFLNFFMQNNFLDIVFCIDATSSMENVIQTVFQSLSLISESLSKKLSNTDIKYGVILFRDLIESIYFQNNFLPEKELEYPEFYPLTNNILEIKNFLQNKKAFGGGNPCEDWVSCFETLFKEFKWTQNSKKLIILFSDNPPHGKEFGGFIPPYEGIDENRHLEQGPILINLIEKCALNKIILKIIQVPTNTNYNINDAYKKIKEIYQKQISDPNFDFPTINSFDFVDVNQINESVIKSFSDTMIKSIYASALIK